MTPIDHEAAKKYANEWITDLDSRAKVRDILATTVGQFTASLIDEGDVISRAYLDLLAREQRAVAAERERDALKAIFGKCTGRFARVRGQCEPVEGYAERPNDILRSIDDLCEHIAALKQRVAELEREHKARLTGQGQERGRVVSQSRAGLPGAQGLRPRVQSVGEGTEETCEKGEAMTNEQLEADIAFLAKRARLADAWSYRTARDTGISSNSIVSRAYGLRVKLELPADADDLAACERAVAKLPKHRRTARVMADLARARKAVKS